MIAASVLLQVFSTLTCVSLSIRVAFLVSSTKSFLYIKYSNFSQQEVHKKHYFPGKLFPITQLVFNEIIEKTKHRKTYKREKTINTEHEVIIQIQALPI